MKDFFSKNWKTQLPQLLIIVAMFVSAAFFWYILPDSIPINFNAQGNSNGNGSKFFVFTFPVIALLAYLFMMFKYPMDSAPHDSERAGKSWSRGINLVIRMTVLLVLARFYVQFMHSILLNTK